jgi:hypothetical protein
MNLKLLSTPPYGGRAIDFGKKSTGGSDFTVQSACQEIKKSVKLFTKGKNEQGDRKRDTRSTNILWRLRP